jgi:hypothetical protein
MMIVKPISVLVMITNLAPTHVEAVAETVHIINNQTTLFLIKRVMATHMKRERVKTQIKSRVISNRISLLKKETTNKVKKKLSQMKLRKRKMKKRTNPLIVKLALW